MFIFISFYYFWENIIYWNKLHEMEISCKVYISDKCSVSADIFHLKANRVIKREKASFKLVADGVGGRAPEWLQGLKHLALGLAQVMISVKLSPEVGSTLCMEPA